MKSSVKLEYCVLRGPNFDGLRGTEGEWKPDKELMDLLNGDEIGEDTKLPGGCLAEFSLPLKILKLFKEDIEADTFDSKSFESGPRFSL